MLLIDIKLMAASFWFQLTFFMPMPAIRNNATATRPDLYIFLTSGLSKVPSGKKNVVSQLLFCSGGSSSWSCLIFPFCGDIGGFRFGSTQIRARLSGRIPDKDKIIILKEKKNKKKNKEKMVKLN